MKYTREFMEGLITPVLSIQENVLRHSKTRGSQPLTGPNSILERTLGNNFAIESHTSVTFETHYVDQDRGRTYTEFAEFIEATELYDANPNEFTAVDMLLEAGDLMYMDTRLHEFYRAEEGFQDVEAQFTTALTYATHQLRKRTFSMELAQQLAQVKFTIRTRLGEHGFAPKDKALEKTLCVEKFNQLRP